ncbi:MAG: sulfurtransferase TusA family protein [bacterium]
MAIEKIDALGLKCPQPVLLLAVKAREMKKGDILEILGDCRNFEKDVRNWAQRMNKVILSVNSNDTDKLNIKIQF